MSGTIHPFSIGGRDAAAILGLDTYRTPFDVWLDKTKTLPRGKSGGAGWWGNLAELPIGLWYRQQTGQDVFRWYVCRVCGVDVCGWPLAPTPEGVIVEAYGHDAAACRASHPTVELPAGSSALRRRNFRHPDFNSFGFAVAQPDFLLEGSSAGLEIKLVGGRAFYDWPKPEDDESGVCRQDPPAQPWAQAQWNMACLSAERWDVVGLLGGTMPVVYPLERDPAVIREMLAEVGAWVKQYLVGGERPPLTGGRVKEYLLAKYATSSGRLRRVSTPEELRALRAMRDAAAAKAAAEEAYDATKPAVMELIGGDDGIEFDLDGTGKPEKITWKRNQPKPKTDWLAVAVDLGADRPEYPEVVAAHTTQPAAEDLDRVLRPYWKRK